MEKPPGEALASAVIWVGSTLLARLMEYTDLVPTYLHQAGWVGVSSTKEQWSLAQLPYLERVAPIPAILAVALKIVNLLPPRMSLVFFKLLSLCWSIAQVSLCGPFRAAPPPFAALVSLGHNSCCFLQPRYRDFFFWHTHR